MTDARFPLRASRRSLLRFLLGSPLLLGARSVSGLEELMAEASDCAADAVERGELISTPAEALHVFDFRATAERALSPGHYAFLATGVDRELGLKANRAGFTRFGLRPRRLVDVRELDTSTEILGTKLSCPIALAPAGLQGAFHPDGELAVARAARRNDHLQILSTGSSASIEEVIAAREASVWFQLYTVGAWPVTRWQLKQAEAVGCPVVVLTVDLPGFGKQDRLRRFRGPGSPFRSTDNANCVSCHGSSMIPRLARAVRAVGVDVQIITYY